MSDHNIDKMAEPWLLSVNELDARRFIYPNMPQYDMADSFRDIRTKLLHVDENQNTSNFVLMISSVTPGSGASFFARNLAAAFAFDDQKTALLIDCNLRKPTVHKYLNIEEQLGLTDHLENNEIDIDQIIYSAGIKRMRVIPIGTKTSSTTDFMASQKMKIFLEQVKERYNDRFVILDCPSIHDSPDARILAEVSDKIVLIAEYGKTSKAALSNVVKNLPEDKITGIILNS